MNLSYLWELPEYAYAMQLLVTGGYGFIGSHFVQAAVKKGHDVTVIDKMTYAANPLNIPFSILEAIKFIPIDIADSSELRKIANLDNPFDWVVNFAAESHVDRSITDTYPFLKSNVAGAINMLDFCKSGASRRMLQISTDEVYGSILSGSWREDAPLLPRSPYSASKASAELFCNAYISTHNSKVTVTRSANNFGPCQSVEKFIPKVITSLLNKQPVEIYGNGLNRREWVFVGHFSEILIELVSSDNISSNIFNIGGKEMMNLDLVHRIAEIMGVKPIIKFVEDRKGHDFRYSVDDNLIYSQLTNMTKPDFDLCLKETIKWYGSNPEWVASSQKSMKK